MKEKLFGFVRKPDHHGGATTPQRLTLYIHPPFFCEVEINFRLWRILLLEVVGDLDSSEAFGITNLDGDLAQETREEQRSSYRVTTHPSRESHAYPQENVYPYEEEKYRNRFSGEWTAQGVEWGGMNVISCCRFCTSATPFAVHQSEPW